MNPDQLAGMIARLQAEFEQASTVNPQSDHARRIAADLARARREAARAVPRILAPRIAPKSVEPPTCDDSGHGRASEHADGRRGGTLRLR